MPQIKDKTQKIKQKLGLGGGGEVIRVLKVDEVGQLWFTEQSSGLLAVYNPKSRKVHTLSFRKDDLELQMGGPHLTQIVFKNGQIFGQTELKYEPKEKGLFRWHSVDGSLENGYWKLLLDYS